MIALRMLLFEGYVLSFKLSLAASLHILKEFAITLWIAFKWAIHHAELSFAIWWLIWRESHFYDPLLMVLTTCIAWLIQRCLSDSNCSHFCTNSLTLQDFIVTGSSNNWIEYLCTDKYKFILLVVVATSCEVKLPTKDDWQQE